METIERLLAHYPATISTVGMAATVAAVVVALYLGRRQSSSRLEIFADIKLYISSEAQRVPTLDLKEAPSIITVTIRNIGHVAVTISYWSSFFWSVPGGKVAAMQNPKEPDFRHQPIELLPGKAASIILTDDLSQYKDMIRNLAEKSRFGFWSRRFPRLAVKTEIGDEFRAKISKSLRQLALSVDAGSRSSEMKV